MTLEQANKNARTAWIYGFRQGDKWFYIGSSLCPKYRRSQLVFKYPPLKRADFVLVRSADVGVIGRIEEQIIANLKARGQCPFNCVATGARGPGIAAKKNTLLWLETGTKFVGIAPAARAMGICQFSLRRQIRDAKGKPFQVYKLHDFPEQQPDGRWSESRPIEGVTLQKL